MLRRARWLSRPTSNWNGLNAWEQLSRKCSWTQIACISVASVDAGEVGDEALYRASGEKQKEFKEARSLRLGWDEVTNKARTTVIVPTTTETTTRNNDCMQGRMTQRTLQPRGSESSRARSLSFLKLELSQDSSTLPMQSYSDQ